MSARLYGPAVHVIQPACHVRDDGTVAVWLDPEGLGHVVVDDTETAAMLALAFRDAHAILDGRQREQLAAQLAQPPGYVAEVPSGHREDAGTDQAGAAPEDGGEPVAGAADGFPAEFPPEAPIGSETCDAADGNWRCTALPGHEGDHAAHGADGTPMRTWPRRPGWAEEETTDA